MTEKIILGPLGPPITTSVSGTDYLNVWKGSALQQITKANFMGATLTGAGTLATGGFTLTVPATGTAALLGTAQTFSAQQTFTNQLVSGPSSTTYDSIFVNMPTGTSGNVLAAYYNATIRHQILAQAALSVYRLNSVDLGSTHGPHVEIGRNTNAATAAGFLRSSAKDGTFYNSWVDASGNWRVSAATLPTSANDTTGTVIGTQTSMAAAKNISEELPDPVEALKNVIKAAREGLRAWSYKSGAFNNEHFPNGLVTDLAPRYGMDRDEAHPAGKSLNIPVAIGDLFAAVALIANHLGINLEDK